MVIDAHVHLTFFKEICPTEELAQSRRELLAYYKTGCPGLERVVEVLRLNGIDRAFLFPFDYSTRHGDLVTNDQVKGMVDRSGGVFYGFASVDPRREDALEELERAFGELKLSGLKLYTSKLAFSPDNAKLYPIYELCVKYNKPITFHAGLEWQPGALSGYAEPIRFERVAADFPKLRFCLAHMGFPWVTETAALLAKYPNMYADTGAMYFDSAREFYGYLFKKAMVPSWLDRGIRHQVLFGTNSQRWIPSKMLEALGNLGLREETVRLITGQNALEFLGEEEINWLS